MACAQVAHAAVAASNRWTITDETYIIVLGASDLDRWPRDEWMEFREPDLDDAVTAICSLNPSPSEHCNLKLWGRR